MLITTGISAYARGYPGHAASGVVSGGNLRLRAGLPRPCRLRCGQWGESPPTRGATRIPREFLVAVEGISAYARGYP